MEILQNFSVVFGENGVGKSAICDVLKSISQVQDFQNTPPSLAEVEITNSEYTFTLRTMIASAIYLNDKELTLRLLRLAKKALYSQPQENYLNSTHLAGSVSKGMAKYHTGDPFRIKENVKKYFGRDIEGTRIYEISDIKTELETLMILGLKDNNYIKTKIQRALNISEQENYIRHKEALLKIAESFSLNGI